MRRAVAAVEGAWIVAAVCEVGRTDHACGSVGRDTGNDKMGVLTAEDAERWVHVGMVGMVPKMLERIIIIH